MRERTMLAGQVEGVQALEAEVADTLELIAMAEADGDAALVTEGERRCAGPPRRPSGARSRACCPARPTAATRSWR